MGGVHRFDEVFFGNAFRSCTEHDCGAVRVVGADVNTVIAAQFLETHPNVGLDVFNEMTDMYMSVCVGQSGGNENLVFQGDVVGMDEWIRRECNLFWGNVKVLDVHRKILCPLAF
jgi:hypothetical protein